MSDGTLSYDITADSGMFQGAAKAATAEVQKLHRELMGLATIAFGPLVAGFAALGAIGDIAIGTKIAAEREKGRIAFKNMIGDAEEAKRVLAELKQYSDTTPFRMGDIKEAASTLIAAGVGSRDLKDEIFVLGNVAAATGGSLSSLARIYGEMKGMGKVDERGMRQFVDQGAGEVKAQLARSLHLSTEELAKLQEQGQITFPMLKQALHDLAGATGKWGNTTKELGQTTIGLWTTLEDKVKDLNGALGEPINAAIKPVLKDLTELADRLQPVMTDIGGAVAGMVTGIDNFIGHAGKGGSIIAELADAMKDMWATAGDYAGAMFSGLQIIVVGLGEQLMRALAPAGEALGFLFVAATEKLEAGTHRIIAMIYDAMANLPFQNEGDVARDKSYAGRERAEAQKHDLNAEKAGDSASAAWKKGPDTKAMASAWAATCDLVKKTANELGKDISARSAKRRDARDNKKKAADAAAEKASKKEYRDLMAKEEAQKVARKALFDRNQQHAARGEKQEVGTAAENPAAYDDRTKPEKRRDAEKRIQIINAERKRTGGLLLPPLPAEKTEKRDTFDVTGKANRPDEAARAIFVRGGAGAGQALMQLAKEALDAGNAIKAKALVDMASKSEMPAGDAAAASLLRLADIAEQLGDKQLATKLDDMARKADENGQKFDAAGRHAGIGGDNIMNSLNNAANKLTGGNGGGGNARGGGGGGGGGGGVLPKQGWQAPPVVGPNSGGTYSVGTHVVGTPYQEIGAGYHPIGEGYTPIGGASQSRNAVFDPANHSNSAVFDPAKHGAMLNQRANGILGGGAGVGPQQAPDAGKGNKADTADSATKTLLQGIQREVAGMNSKMQSLGMA